MITFIYSTVNAGKSANLLMRAHSCETSNIPYIMLIPEIVSGRDGEGFISSRTGFKAQALTFTEESNLYLLSAGNAKIVFVDEAQFLSKQQVFDLCALSTEGIKVYAYGLRTDFQGELFEGSQYLLAWADQIEEISTFSRRDTSNPAKATFNIKIDDQGERVRTGASKDVGFHYVPVSLKEFLEGADIAEDLSR